MPKKEKLVNDKYRKARGGYARMLRVSCESCGTKVCLYQKDGPGLLKRLYIDRMQPKRLDKILACTKCKTILGTYYIYKKEHRPAYRLYQDAVKKKIYA